MSSKKEPSASIEMGGVILNPGECIGSYRYEKPIGKGGMADVLLAYDPNGQPMALKVLKASRFRTGRRRFRREFRALAKLRHPNVIQVDSFGDIFGHPYFAMEYIDGTDLHKSIREFRKIPFEDRWHRVEEILIDLTQGLHYIHSRGLVHRDLKPSNVLIDKHGQCKITDFGIVKDLNPDEDLSTTLVGTWAYASPEQISGRPLDNRSDLYSLGIILYAMLTGRRPFAAENMAGYLKLHRDQPPRSPSSFIPEIPTRLEDICLRLLQKSPQDRYQSALEILDALGFHQFADDPTTEEVAPWIIPSGGRNELNAEMEKYLTDLLSQQGNVVQIIGAEGLGKSRIIKDFVEKAKSRDLHTFYCSITPQQGPFVNPIKIASHIATESGDQDLTTSISTLENSDQNLDADLKYQLFERSREALQKLLEERPQIFVFDDIH
ncbi:MAG: serine/threonine-protein kinase, partial [Myxococcota bacterium]|nr:serine/threonine-protein kinase [Myxococcota bacterium]